MIQATNPCSPTLRPDTVQQAGAQGQRRDEIEMGLRRGKQQSNMEKIGQKNLRCSIF